MHPYDFRLVQDFINKGSHCPSETIIKYYVYCKNNDKQVPKAIDDKVTNWLNAIIEALDNGTIPKLKDVLNIEVDSGRRKINKHKKIKLDLLLSAKVEEYVKQGLTKEKAFFKISNDPGVKVSNESVKKAHERAKKTPLISR